MDVLLLEKDGRCVWLENKVLKGLMPMAIRNSVNPFAQSVFLIVDWISNDFGRVGVDLKWLKTLGVPVVEKAKDLPAGKDFKVINTGYDSIVDEEIILRSRGVDIIDRPCPFVRKLRDIFTEHDGSEQIVLLCEDNHIVVKNYASIFPEDLILVQMHNYKERITMQRNGKPLKLVPYVTFLETDAEEIMAFIKASQPGLAAVCERTACIWVKSKASPIQEINQLGAEKLQGVKDALLITTANSTNKSVVSLENTLKQKGLNVVQIGSLRDFLQYEKSHVADKVLVVRSPIPNQAEYPIMQYIKHGLVAAYWAALEHSPLVKIVKVKLYKLFYFAYFRFKPQAAKQEAAQFGLLKSPVEFHAGEQR
jgi:4-hydroxy-3-methylbut-2-enyl diphosphate reductase IspH